MLPDDAHISKLYTDLPGGDIVMADLDLPEDSYIVAYSLSPKATKPGENNFCASVFVLSLAPGTELTANGVKIVQGHSYVAAFFTGGYDAQKQAQSSRKQMVCVVTFDADAR